MMQPLGGACWMGKQLAQRSTMTSSRPVTTAGRVVVLGLRRSNGITLSDGAARGNRAQSRRYLRGHRVSADHDADRPDWSICRSDGLMRGRAGWRPNHLAGWSPC